MYKILSIKFCFKNYRHYYLKKNYQKHNEPFIHYGYKLNILWEILLCLY